MSEPPVFGGNHLVVRELGPDDAHLVAAVEIACGNPPPGTPFVEARRVVERSLAEVGALHIGGWVHDTFVGFVVVRAYAPVNGAAGGRVAREIGYAVHPAVHRRGYGRQLVDVAIAEARRVDQEVELVARVAAGNAASCALCRSLGFRPVAEAGDRSQRLVFSLRP